MIVDCILDRYDGFGYDPKEFYRDMLMYKGSGIDISRAMDFGTNEDVQKELCNYITKNDYNPLIKDFINKANWLVPEEDTDWSKIIKIREDD